MSQLSAHPSVVCTVLEDGGVLLHLETKYYYSLNAVGLALWLHLEAGQADLGAALAARFPAVPEREAALAAFVNLLRAEKLVEPATGAGTGSGESLGLAADAAWEAPRLTRHEAPLNQILSNPFDPCVPLAE